ncbi:MAG: hypothetical protein DI586_09710 [Micavibrio aeruginosavorus]|uniref:Glycosyl transferase family 1 domain-containing protein n=1 Tax=Micavibrio aeruginosavorus TaxID=349221 RepID=A0A2W5FET6_9BACT|nr:MAG: hypothetical protein DI586_09710 [Micavibrio aeruginosavorus]
MKIYLTYKTVDKPWGGANNFLRSLKEKLASQEEISFTEETEEADIIFMNQVSAGPGSDKRHYTLTDIKKMKEANPNARVIIRAVSLKIHFYPTGPFKYYFGNGWRSDRNVISIMNYADFVIFQSAYQKSFFDKHGFRGKKFTIIHNGAADIFGEVLERPELKDNQDLYILSSSVGKGKMKKHDLIAAASLLDRVKVFHAGTWPDDISPEKINLCGVLDHLALKKIMSRCHYFYHPAIRDACPNSLIEGLYAGMPALYNSAEGSSQELAHDVGIAINEKDLSSTIRQARNSYEVISDALLLARDRYGIKRAAEDYYKIFKAQIEAQNG